jgi:hypothetical protein
VTLHALADGIAELGVVVHQPVEGVGAQSQQLDLPHRRDRRRARLAPDQRPFAHEVAGADRSQLLAPVATLAHDAQPAVLDDEERIARLALAHQRRAVRERQRLELAQHHRERRPREP